MGRAVRLGAAADDRGRGTAPVRITTTTPTALAAKFISLVTKEFQEHGTIVEKYDVRRRESDVAAGIKFGYSGNQVGFGWTNGVVLELIAQMPQAVKR